MLRRFVRHTKNDPLLDEVHLMTVTLHMRTSVIHMDVNQQFLYKIHQHAQLLQ